MRNLEKMQGAVAHLTMGGIVLFALSNQAHASDSKPTKLVVDRARTEAPEVIWEANDVEEPFALVGGWAADESGDGPGKLQPFHVVPVDGNWWAFGGELTCGPHAGIWFWNGDAQVWNRGQTSGTAPDARAEHVVWTDGADVVWCAFGNPMALQRFEWGAKRWLPEQPMTHSSIQPVIPAVVLKDYVVWVAQDRDLVVLRKEDFGLARFPQDAWAGYLMDAWNAPHMEVNGGNVLEFGATRERMGAYDFSEKVRYANFKDPFDSMAESTRIDWASSNRFLLPWLLLVLSWGGFGWWIWRRRVASNAHHAPTTLPVVIMDQIAPDGNPQDVMLAISHWSEQLRALVLSGKRAFTANELDELWGIQFIESPETLRAKRSRNIQSVNTEFNLLFGFDLIRRKRDEHDRRKVLYHLAALPPNLAKTLHRDSAHQLHAYDGADRSDRVTEDRE